MIREILLPDGQENHKMRSSKALGLISARPLGKNAPACGNG
jgi:hypothetical protein